ncbi:YkvA family protein [Paenibacillus sp. HJGM_3]|uniref:YkvA family protein n=1 Tax=Paenibacillus sp. HJGM_3 TaxID=3379816 RepID=UPI00385B0F8C
MLENLKSWAKQLKRKVFVLYYAYQDKRTPWYAKVFAVCVVAYAFSPIDLIPDFIPILGYLDDVILIPLGVALALKMIPAAVIQACTVKAEARLQAGKPKNWLVGSLIILVWIAVLIWILWLAYRYFGPL